MKKFLIFVLFCIPTHLFAASTLFCNSDDGTTITAIETPKGELVSIKLSIRGFPAKSYPNAYVASIEESNGDVSFLVINDPSEGILLVVKDDLMIDSTGTYEVSTCEISM